jgi:ATP-dependent DNA helicase RecG
MNEKELKAYVQANYPKENEACEWKAFTNLKGKVTGARADDIASYVSAIANVNGGHLVIGVQDKTLHIVGIQQFFNYTKENVCQRLVGFCAHLDSEKFKVEEFLTADTRKTIWVLHIPKHQPRLPVYAHGHPWQRLGDSLVPMRQERLDAILAESFAGNDWSAVIVEKATIEHLDKEAIRLAREKFTEKHSNAPWKAEISDWNAATFLDKAGLTAQGQTTQAALLLIGRGDAAHFLSPHPAQITWKLEGEEVYEHFGPPFILTTTSLLKRIRNVTYKLFPSNQLLGVEIPTYDTRTILEGLHNCIAHQDYEKCERVLVTETPDRLIFENIGCFFDGIPDDYFAGKKTPKRYRNPWLVSAMAKVGMIDTMGYGIHNMTKSQRKRYLPLPGYRGLTTRDTKLEVLGRPIDQNYTQLLLKREDLDLDTVILLDRVQKKLPITDTAAARLRKERLIEGRKPNFHVSAAIAAATDTEADYKRAKGISKVQMKQFLLAQFKELGGIKRDTFEDLIVPLLPVALTEKQKSDRVKNLLSEMKRDNLISPDRPGRGAIWNLAMQTSKNAKI